MIPTHIIGAHGRNILCLDCGLTSWHPEDVRRRYCHFCAEFHDDKETRARTHERLADESSARPSLSQRLFSDWF